MAPLGRVNPEDESNISPVPSSSDQLPSLLLMREFWFPEVMFPGGKTSRSPSAFFSMRRASFSELSFRSTSSVSRTIGSSRSTMGPKGSTRAGSVCAESLFRNYLLGCHLGDTCQTCLASGEVSPLRTLEFLGGGHHLEHVGDVLTIKCLLPRCPELKSQPASCGCPRPLPEIPPPPGRHPPGAPGTSSRSTRR